MVLSAFQPALMLFKSSFSIEERANCSMPLYSNPPIEYKMLSFTNVQGLARRISKSGRDSHLKVKISSLQQL